MVREQYSKEFVLEELKIDKTKVESFLDVAFYDSTVKSFELEKYSNNSFFSTTLIIILFRVLYKNNFLSFSVRGRKSISK